MRATCPQPFRKINNGYNGTDVIFTIGGMDMKRKIDEEVKNMEQETKEEEEMRTEEPIEVEAKVEDAETEKKKEEEPKSEKKGLFHLPSKETVAKGLKIAGAMVLAFGAGAGALALIGARAAGLPEKDDWDKPELEDKGESEN